jgi:hypothetical protein
MATPINTHVSLLLDQRGDSYTLPTELIRKRGALAALDRAMQSEVVSASSSLGGTRSAEDEIRLTIRDGLIQAAMDAKEPIPLDMEPLVRYREQVAVARDRYGIIELAAKSLAVSLENEVRHRADEIITEHLGPAIVECMDQARRLVEGLGEREPSRSGLYDAPQEARDAFDALTQLAERYGRVRAAYRHLRTLLTGQLERDWRRVLLSEFRQESLALAWPEWNDVRHNPLLNTTVYPTLPWPDDPAGRLVWIARSGVETWVPTPEQLADALAEVDKRISETVSEVADKPGQLQKTDVG